jgi:putative Holliday junction resolvase
VTFRLGTRVAVDVGEVRVGVARSDAAGTLALPVRTLRRAPDGSEIGALARIVEEFDAIEVVVGLPLALSGRETEAAARARRYAGEVARRIRVPVRLVDERLTTVSAHQALHGSGRPGRKHRSVVDQVAATMILDQALAIERSTGEPAGELLEGTDE